MRLLRIIFLSVALWQIVPFQAAAVSVPPPGSPPQTRPTNLHPSNEGNEFYIGFMDNYVKPAFQNIETLIVSRSEIFMMTSDPSGAIAMIESEQGTSIENVSPDFSRVRAVERFKVQTGRDRTKGIKIKAEQLKQISVFAVNEELHSVDGFIALPCNYLPSVSTYEYYAVSVPPSTASQTTADSAFLIVACSDGTTVSITPTQDIQHPHISNVTVRAGTTFDVELQERETLYIQHREDLTGSRVESQSPISFFSGHECGNVPADVSECDHLVEQIPPTATWGQQFIIAPTANRRAADLIKVVSSEHHTSGNVTCVTKDPEGNDEVDTFSASLVLAGHYISYSLSYDTFCYIETNKPVLMVQFTAGGEADGESDADPFMVIVPAVRQYLDVTKFSTLSTRNVEFNHFANVLVPAGPGEFDPSGILIDGEPVEADVWAAIPCTHNESICAHAAQVHISDGVHSIWNSDGGPVGVTVYGFDYLETYAYVGGLKLTVPGYEMAIVPTSHFVLAGTSICLPCEPTGVIPIDPGATVTWNKDGTIIVNSERISINTNRSLCISEANPNDSGTYGCVVSHILYPSTITVSGGIIVESPACGSNETEALIGIGQGTAYLDSSTNSFQICCRVMGPAGYTVTWLNNDSTIAPTATGYEFGDDYLRYVGGLTRGCSKYTCRVNFSTTTREEHTEICIGDISPPTYVGISSVGGPGFLEGTRARYECQSDGFPTPTKMWTAFRDGNNSILPVNASDDGNGFLNVLVSEWDMYRRYCCDVSNGHGNVLSQCITINVLIRPQITKTAPTFAILSLPYGTKLPLENQVTSTIAVGRNVMIPQTYRLVITCNISRGNPDPTIVWYRGSSMIQGSQYSVEEDGSLVIESVLMGRDDGIYTCIADTPNVGQDEAISTVIITIPPKINTSDLVKSPGNCLDLTRDPLALKEVQPIGADLCLRAGLGVTVSLKCSIAEGTLHPTIRWFKDGTAVTRYWNGNPVLEESEWLDIEIPSQAYGTPKDRVEGNYTCWVFNVAGGTRMESHVTLFGDIPMVYAKTEFVTKQKDVYNQLYKTISEHIPRVQDGGSQHLSFFTSGKLLPYEDFDPGYLYDESEESVLPQTMENIFDLVDIIPTEGAIVFSPDKAQRLEVMYSQLVDMLQVAPSSLKPEEQKTTRLYFQESILDPGTGTSLPRLSLYLQYKNTYYTTKMEVDNLIDSQRRGLLGWEFTQWYERNIHRLQMQINDAYMKWEMYADKAEVEDKLNMLNLEDHSQDVNEARALLLANERMSRFKDEKQYYLVKLYPDTWYKELRNRVQESIEQMQFQLSQLRTEIEILEITSRYLDQEASKREALNALFPSLDPVYQLYCDLDTANYQLEQIVKQSEDMRYECLVSGNPADCHLYWGLKEHIRDTVLGNYTEFYWYVHTVQAALNHRDYSIPAIGSTIGKLQERVSHVQSAIDIALSDLSE